MIKAEQIMNGDIPVTSYDSKIYNQMKKYWDSVAKPLDSMGIFETLISKVGAIHGLQAYDFDKNAVIVMCADNGIVKEGISQSDQSVTAICTENIGKMQSAVGIMAKTAGIEIIPIDIGVNTKNQIKMVRNLKVTSGTKNFLKEPAMTREETLQAMQIGMDLVEEYKKAGYGMIGTGEMGIGNTTTSSTVAAALLDCNAIEVTGRGAGLNDRQLEHKIEVIQKALDKYHFSSSEPFEILCTVGGLDIAGLTGLIIGGAIYKMPIVLDGVISMVAALTAERIAPGVKDYLVPSHISREPAAKKIMEELNLRPVIDADMALGEGTGAVMMISLLKMTYKVLQNSYSFKDAGVQQYVRYKGENQ